MGASMKEIKNRIKSVQSTRQITKAMELVASSKVRRARERIERTEPFFNILYETMTGIAYGKRDFKSPFVEPREEIKKVCYVIIAGDRGLAGGYNSNVMKLVGAPYCAAEWRGNLHRAGRQKSNGILQAAEYGNLDRGVYHCGGYEHR